MLTTRLWMGALLIAAAVGMLAFDQPLAPWYPFLFVFQIGLALAGCHELIMLLGPERSPHKALCYLGVAGMGVANWAVYLLGDIDSAHAWLGILGCYIALMLVVFAWEMATFREPGRSAERIALTWLTIGYLGLLPCYFAQLRWLYPAESQRGTAALALAIFVPKGCDIGAYFTGRLLGRHKMAPVLSPKKTWEGAIGGLVFAALIAIGLDRFGPAPILGSCLPCEIVFGVLAGGAAMLGDLAESLLKRDCQKKDTSAAVPGFGGVLDVVDAVLFAAPVVYGCLWFGT
jgi:phosphatidate cytidylyltransferase